MRIVVIDGKPWWVAADVCKVLGLVNNRSAMEKIPAEHRGVHRMDTSLGIRTASMLSEPGLYWLTLRCDKPAALPFMKWVTEKVLPKLRKESIRLPGEDLPEQEEDFLVQTRETARKLMEMSDLAIRQRDVLKVTEQALDITTQALRTVEDKLEKAEPYIAFAAI